MGAAKLTVPKARILFKRRLLPDRQQIVHADVQRVREDDKVVDRWQGAAPQLAIDRVRRLKAEDSLQLPDRDAPLLHDLRDPLPGLLRVDRQSAIFHRRLRLQQLRVALDCPLNPLRLDADVPLRYGGRAVLQQSLHKGDVIAVVLVDLRRVPFAE